MRMAPAELFSQLREEVELHGRLETGTLDLPALRRDGSIRRVPEGDGAADVAVGDGWSLGVKWPAYVQLIERMPGTRFIVCLRHPLDTIASFKLVGGSVKAGMDYNIPFNRAMNDQLRSVGTEATRRVALYEYVHTLIRPHLDRANVLAVRYEDWFTDPTALWSRIEAFLERPLNPPTPRIRHVDRRDILTAEDRRLIAEQCKSASWLGYDLESA